MTEVLTSARKALWHLRRGGLPQLLEHRRRLRRGAEAGRRPLFSDDRQLRFEPFRWPDVPPRRALRVGVIADDFTRAAFAYEWTTVELRPSAWQAQLAGLDLLFVESAWHGNRDAWEHQLTGPSAPSDELRDLVAAASASGVPTVFWNKEDPTHLEDFLATAELFDHVFTTDEACVPEYRRRLGHDRVGCLPFAVQERVTNPVRRYRGEHERGIAFGGTWFAHKFPERRQQMRMLFDAAIAVEEEDTRFDIFSRFLGLDEKYQFPEPYASHVVGGLTYDQMLSAYRSYRVFLNVNTVTSSTTMFARRLLEIVACGTPVVTTPTPAVTRFLGDGVAQVASQAEAEQALRALLREPDVATSMVHRGQRELWRAHTYSHRVAEVLRAVGLHDTAHLGAEVSVVMSTKRPHQLHHALEQVARQEGVRVQWLLGAHDFEPDPAWVASARERGVDVEVLTAPASWSLGEVLNALVDRADCPLVSKMDDDDLYLPHYLGDLLASHRVSGADVVGKHERWVHLAQRDVSVLTSAGMAWRPTTFVAGPTITASRELARIVRFPALNRSEDTGFLKAVVAEGATIVGTDPFNFVQMRSGARGNHSWDVDDSHFLRAARHVAGLPMAVVEV